MKSILFILCLAVVIYEVMHFTIKIYRSIEFKESANLTIDGIVFSLALSAVLSYMFGVW